MNRAVKSTAMGFLFLVLVTGGISTAKAFNAEFVKIPGGVFMMGSPDWEQGRSDSELFHEVLISREFEMQTTELTQLQWVSVMGSNPSKFQNPNDCPGDHQVIKGVPVCTQYPVEMIYWTIVQEFLTKLNRSESNFYYRLPTEAEWEYAARAGSKQPYYFGDEVSKLGNYAWYIDNSGNHTHPVAKLIPNSFGLYDMHGNVWELVQDWYAPYPQGPIVDPRGPSDGYVHSLRGGSWYIFPRYLRSAQRNAIDMGEDHSDIGFRLVREPRR